ncbi:hypothetical protein JHD46_05365 [Sulfurimonas sp. SAG-AH-194-C20]|nr:hypothetical protein [Sulfurimonas sp. SAG-AH-194-C20]MDF1879068.1 hypothetical protein [Sulfurimonas sp. SAG-AH-194-C20]
MLFHVEDYKDEVEEFFQTFVASNETEVNDDNVDDEIWALARETKDLPHIGNIVVSVIYGRITSALVDKFNLQNFPNFPIKEWIDATGSSYDIAGTSVVTQEEAFRVMNEWIKEQGVQG